jgi:hypothetical protein
VRSKKKTSKLLIKGFIICYNKGCINFYPAIGLFLKKMLFNLIIKKKDNANPIDTSIVVPVRGMA